LRKNYLLYPAQFWPHKNHANLIHAITILRDRHKLKFSLVLVGTDKGNKNYITKLASEFEIGNQILFLGFVPRQDLIALYENALALTYVTFFGPENLPPLEAFALGCPVIASNVSGSEEQLGDAALMIDPKSPQQIAIAIKEINENRELRNTLIQRGKIRALKWTSDDFVREMFPFFNEFESIARCWVD
jgi:glycosyltransferase involved in cell wall biosynthesis